MSEKRYYAGIDLGGTFIKCGILSECGDILIKDQIPTGKDRPYVEIARDMADFVVSLASRAGVSVSGIGIGSPGAINSATGVIVYSNNIAWENVPLGEEVAKLTGLPVKVANDANVAALGEGFVGGGRNYNSYIVITLGTGVGGGVIIDGKLFEGNLSAGTELGHMVIRTGGASCTCGRRGCFEAYSSATALIRQTKTAMRRHRDSAMWQIAGALNRVDGKTAFDAAAVGDTAASEVVGKYVDYLADGITNLANIFRPEAILIGGGVSKQGDALITPLKREVEQRIYGIKGYAPVEIATATLANDAGICGAVKLIIDNM